MCRYRPAILGSFSLFVGLWGLIAQPAFGQLSATGLDQFGTFQRTPIQTMNLSSLNNHIEIDLFSKRERGNTFDAKLVWDFGDSLSLVYGWGVPPSCCFYQTNGPGLRDITDVNVTSAITSTGHCGGFNDPNTSATTYFYSITDQNNTVHQLPNGTGVTTGQDCNAGTLRASTTDGQWLLTVTYTNQNCFEEGCITSITETDPAGNVYNGGIATDPNGNQISKTITQNGVNGIFPIKWTDPTGNTAFTQQSENPDVYTYGLPASGTANIQVNYLSGYTLQNNFGCPVQGYLSASGATSLPSSISLADGSSYSFIYESADGTYPSTTITGRIHSITVPTRGTYTYTYSGWCSLTLLRHKYA